MAKSLYICYFGVREPLVQTQVLPYLREIRKDGIEVSILTFEPGDITAEIGVGGIAEIREKLASEGIAWHWLPYHKRFSVLATAWDIFRGTLFIRRFIARERPDVLHGRVHVPTLMGALARKLSRHRPKLLFDIRGFFPEEYTDAGIWPEGGWLYRGAKRVERWLMKEADGFVVLTEKARQILFPESLETGYDRLGRPVEVIPCCVDFANRFSGDRDGLRAVMRRRLGIEDRFTVVHLGALGGLYLTEEIADFLKTAREKESSTFAMFLTQSRPELITPLLKERGFGQDDMLVTKIPPTEVEDHLAAADVALSFVKAGYATASRSPTKIPEYLACALPVVSNRGVGDVDAQIADNDVGVLLDGFNDASYEKALDALANLIAVADRCRETAMSEFDLESVGGERYRRLYEKLLRDVR